MATTETRSDYDVATALEVEAMSRQSESLAERVLSFTAMAGAVGGAVAGVVLGADAGTAYPLAWGTAGTMLGSGLAAGAWCLLSNLWAGAVAGGRKRGHAVRSGAVTAMPGAR